MKPRRDDPAKSTRSPGARAAITALVLSALTLAVIVIVSILRAP